MIPDDEPWWKVRETIDGESTDGRSMSTAAAIGDRYGGRQSMPRTCPLAAEHDDREDTLQALDALPFRPIGYEW